MVVIILGAIMALIATAPAMAHFRLNTNIRIFHIERLDDGLRVYLRKPTPLAFASYLAGTDSGSVEIKAPFVRSAVEEGQRVHYLDIEALRADPAGYGQLVSSGYKFTISGTQTPGEVEAVAIHPTALAPSFAELSDARRALQAGIYPAGADAVFVGDSVTDLQLFFPGASASAEIRIKALLPEGYEPDGYIANIFLDTVGNEKRITRAAGLMREEVVLNTSALTAARTFVDQGVWHILDGLDHVLFVLCLTIGAATFGALLWRVTGFTVGHTITLIAGFLGYTPSGSWFIPGIEAAIALSIIYAAAIALMRKTGAATAVPITVGIGLLHGFGFSFVLTDMLSLEAPHLLLSLISFNIGVEIGQVAIVLAVWPALYLLGRRWMKAQRFGVVAIASGAIALASYWTVQRVAALTDILIS